MDLKPALELGTAGVKLANSLLQWNEKDFPFCNTREIKSKFRFLWFFPARYHYIHTTADGTFTHHVVEIKSGRSIKIIPEIFRFQKKRSLFLKK